LFVLSGNPAESEKHKVNVLLEGLTADQIRKKFYALICSQFNRSSEAFLLGKPIYRLQEILINLRNSFAHGTTWIGKNDLMKDAEDW